MKRSDTMNRQLRHNDSSMRVGKQYSVIKEMGNPFQEETADLLTLDTKIIAIPDSGNMTTSHYKTGQSRFKAFIGGLDKGDEGSFYDPIKKNKLDFFQHTLFFIYFSPFFNTYRQYPYYIYYAQDLLKIASR